MILRKYNMYEEELYVIDKGLEYVSTENRHREELLQRRQKLIELLKNS